MNKISLILMGLVPTLTFAQAKLNEFTITGKIGKLNSPSKVYLQYGGTIDSASLSDGRFTLHGKTGDFPRQTVLLLNKKGTGILNSRDYIQFYIEKGDIVMNSSTDSLNLATVTGTATNLDNLDYKLATKSLVELNAKEYVRRSLITAEMKKSSAYLKSLSEFSVRSKKAAREIDITYINSHPGSIISFILVSGLAYSEDYGMVAQLFNSLDPKIKASAEGKKFNEQLTNMKNIAIGSVATDFELPDTNGNLFKLSSLRGKYVLIDFWASWCVPCRQENPNLVKVFNKYKSRNFTVLGVSLDRPDAKKSWLDAINNDGLTWNHVSDLKFWNSKAAILYGVKVIPQNFLIDPRGVVVAKNLIGEALEAKLAEVLEK